MCWLVTIFINVMITNSHRPTFCWKWTQRSVLLLLGQTVTRKIVLGIQFDVPFTTLLIQVNFFLDSSELFLEDVSSPPPKKLRLLLSTWETWALHRRLQIPVLSTSQLRSFAAALHVRDVSSPPSVRKLHLLSGLRNWGTVSSQPPRRVDLNLTSQEASPALHLRAALHLPGSLACWAKSTS